MEENKMLDVILVILILFAIILMLYSIMERSPAFSIMTSVLWLIIALFMLQGVEVPYEMFNATSGNIESGVHLIQTNLDPLSYLFMGLGAIMFLLFVTFAMEMFTDYKKMRR
jgi:formate hydrogenlyase subunit 3/multisubunit Na+/H+ antiporter MnhD subunit